MHLESTMKLARQVSLLLAGYIILGSASVKTRMSPVLYIVFLKDWGMTTRRFIIEFSDH